jgi:uncharacterized protein (DUF697 family)
LVKTKKAPVKPTAVFGILKELKASAKQDRPIVVSGARGLVPVLVEELTRGGVASAVREQEPLEDAAVLVQVLAGELASGDEERLKEAASGRLPIVAVALGVPGHIPYVLEENVVRVGTGTGFPVEEIARRLAKVLGERGTPLAARLPVLRRPVCDVLIRKFSRQNALFSVAVFLPGDDMPVLTLNQVRMVLRIADAYGFEIDKDRLPEVLGVIGSGLGFRAVARKAGRVRFVGWAVKGAIAYMGTRALGEAAVRYFERRAPVTRIAGARVKL